MSTRTIIQSEAIAWLNDNAAPPLASVITSLPDVSEMPERSFDAWRVWFIATARHILRWVPDDGLAIFFSSDTRHENVWVDKGHWLATAGDQENAKLWWHKIVCRLPPGSIGHGRSTYSHMLCYSRRFPPIKRETSPDVLADAGFMPWSKAMGANACRVACEYVRDATSSTVIVDPFCGSGTALAVANQLGFDAIGVDHSARRCRAARRLVIAD